MKNFKTTWKSLKNSMTSLDMLNYCLLKAINAKSENKLEIAKALIAKAYTPITNETKLLNGAKPYQALKSDLYSLKLYTNWKGGNEMKIFGQPIEEFFETPNEFETYKELVTALYDYNLNKLNRYYCYIFVDIESVSPEQAMVQAAHDPHEVFFQIVERPLGLSAKELEARHQKYDFHHFVEPDLGDKIIASATRPIPWWNRQELGNYSLVNFKKSA